MTFSNEWEIARASNRNMSTWPWSDLITYVNRYASPEKGYRRILEIGCGVGANVPFFRKLEVDYYAVEGSQTAANSFRELHPDFADRLAVADFTVDLVHTGPFDLIVDRSALTFNDVSAVKRALRMIIRNLRPGGKYIGIDWFSTEHQDSGAGEALDEYTRHKISSGHLAGLGVTQFVNGNHLIDLVVGSGFLVERLEHKMSQVTYPAHGEKLAWWHVVAVKP